MTTARALAERFAQTLTDHDLDAFAELLDGEYINHNRYALPGREVGRHLRRLPERLRGLSSRSR